MATSAARTMKKKSRKPPNLGVVDQTDLPRFRVGDDHSDVVSVWDAGTFRGKVGDDLHQPVTRKYALPPACRTLGPRLKFGLLFVFRDRPTDVRFLVRAEFRLFRLGSEDDDGFFLVFFFFFFFARSLCIRERNARFCGKKRTFASVLRLGRLKAPDADLSSGVGIVVLSGSLYASWNILPVQYANWLIALGMSVAFCPRSTADSAPIPTPYIPSNRSAIRIGVDPSRTTAILPSAAKDATHAAGNLPSSPEKNRPTARVLVFTAPSLSSMRAAIDSFVSAFSSRAFLRRLRHSAL
jgi:hypothetical protein